MLSERLCYFFAAFLAITTIRGTLGAGRITFVDDRSRMTGLPSAVVLGSYSQHHTTKRLSPPIEEFNNGTVVEDSHIYYNSTFHTGTNAEAMWIDLAELYRNNGSNVTRSSLSDQSRGVSFVSIPFPFPYYGHILRSIGITTHGFLYTGTIFHSRIEDFQYIAPLQANFRPSNGNNSEIYHLSTESRLTVQWSNVLNEDHEDAGAFNFQVSLFPSGEIQFVYRQVPLDIDSIESGNFPVRVGISDAYFLTLFRARFFSYGYIVEYHATNLTQYPVGSNTAITLNPLPNCIGASTCQECSDLSATTGFECRWCSRLNRCSDGIDRNRFEWIQNGCHTLADGEPVNCETSQTVEPLPNANCFEATTCSACVGIGASSSVKCRWCPTLSRCTFAYEELQFVLDRTCPIANTSSLCPTQQVPTQSPQSASPNNSASVGVSVFIIILALIIIVVVVAVVILYYGYRRPSSKVGNIMIKHLKFKPAPREYDIKTERLISTQDGDDI